MRFLPGLDTKCDIWFKSFHPKNAQFQSNGIRTPFGEVNKANNYQGGGEEKRSQFSREVFINQWECTGWQINWNVLLSLSLSNHFKWTCSTYFYFPRGKKCFHMKIPSHFEHYISKRSITSLSLFSGSKKDEEHHQSSEVQNNNKDRKNSLGRLRARSSLDLSSLGFGSISRASSKAGLTDLKEEADSIKTANKEKLKINSKLFRSH